MIAVPLYTPHLKTIYAGVLLWTFAISKTIYSFKHDSSIFDIPNSTYDPAPRLLNPVTAIPFSLQNLISLSYVLYGCNSTYKTDGLIFA